MFWQEELVSDESGDDSAGNNGCYQEGILFAAHDIVGQTVKG